MSGGFRFRRDPDPSRPGTVYRSKPKVGRNRGLSSGPPYLEGSLRDAPAAETPPNGVGAVYREHGGENGPDPYGQNFDDRGRDQPVGARPPGARAGGPERDRPAPPGRGYDGGSGLPRFRMPRPRFIVLILIVVLIGYPILLGFTAWTSLNRVDALTPAHEKADTEETPGRTFLVVGSDSRGDLSKEEQKKLGTGSVAGQRTDTIMLLHVPSGGGPTVLISVPRDSYVPIPGRSRNKINAAYAFGGPSLLVQTLEAATGLRIDNYVETGLGGFANIVDAVGGSPSARSGT